MITIVPAIDIIEGKCVRLTQGDYKQKKIYSENPLEIAKHFEDYGIKRLHMVDLEGARAGKVVNHAVLEQIATKTGLMVDFGGGIKSDEDIRIVFQNGAMMATIGSIAVTNQPLLKQWLEEYGPEKIILGADSREHKIVIGGWMETTAIDIYDFISAYHKAGVIHFLCTDICKDGMMQGTSIGLYKELRERFPKIKIIASGGLTSINEIDELNKLNVDSVILGKAYYEGTIKLEDLKRFI